MAVRVLTMLLEGALVEQLEAEGTVEVLRVPLLAHSSDAFASDWFLAAVAESSPGGMVVDFTVGLTLVLKVVPPWKGNSTNLAREAFWVPLGIDGCDEALHDGLVTATTARSKLLIVALSAECLAVFLVEPLCPKMLAT